MKNTLYCVSLFFLLAAQAIAQSEPEVSPDELPRLTPTEPADALATFELSPGFSIDLVAHEPDVTDPIAMAFDEQGRAYVLEMRGYSERREDAICRIRLLTDTNNDGVFDKSTIFKDNMKWPTALLCYKGGIFVGATPDLYYFKDNDGDGICDEERTVFTGFGEGNPRLNMQALFNSLCWGPDNRIWGATAGNGGIVTRPDDPSFEPVSIRGADFSFDPEKLDFRAENGTAQYGMSYDSLGRRFVCTNSRHLIWVAYEREQVNPNPWFSLPPPLVDIPDDGAAAPVYRISPDEPWRIVRTRWRVASVVKGAIEGGGRVSGYFTSATGIHLYTGDAFPPEFRDNAFIGDVGSNLVHRKLIKSVPGSVQPLGTRPAGEEKTEFLRSTDIWFRPTSFVTGPDGCLYITDMYREVIEHPWSLPESIKKHLDLNSGNDRGRIYRVAPTNFKPGEKPWPNLGKLSDAELVELTHHANDWHRTTARRLLYERGKAADPLPPVSPFPALLASEEPLFDRIESSIGDRWMEATVLNSLRTPADLQTAWERSMSVADSFRASLISMIGRSGDAATIQAAISTLVEAGPNGTTATLLSSLHEGVRRSRGDWKSYLAAAGAERLSTAASAVLTDTASKTDVRIAAVKVLSLLPESSTQDDFRKALESADPALAAALIPAIRDLDFLIDRFSSLSPEVRSELSTRIAANAKGSIAFLSALRDKKINLAEVPASLTEQLRKHSNKEVETLAAEVLPPVIERDDVIAAYQPALAKKGDPEKGKQAFMKACITCHQTHDGEGIVLGPPIASFASAGADSILSNILDPNREVAPQFQAYTFEFHNDAPLTGIIVSENATEVTLRIPGGIERTFPRSEVAGMRGLGQSLMPEGLEATLTIDEMADLLAYLLNP